MQHAGYVLYRALVNPRCMRRRVTVVILCVSVFKLAATYLINFMCPKYCVIRWRSKHIICVDFAKDSLFDSFGATFLAQLTGKLSMATVASFQLPYHMHSCGTL